MKAYLILGVCAMSALAAVVGYRLGSAGLSETDAILAVADIWVSGGGAPEDCAGIPGRDSWLVVQCESDNARRVWTVTGRGLITEVEAGT